MSKRILSILLALCLVFTGISATTSERKVNAASTIFSAPITVDGGTVNVNFVVLTDPSGSNPGTVQLGDGSVRAIDIASTGLVEIPNTVMDGSNSYIVTIIGANAFNYCSLSDISIPDSVTSIGVNAFNTCLSLTSVSIPDSVTSIGANAFSNCSSLTSVTIPGSVSNTGNYAFMSCTNLQSVILENGAAAIGYGEFYNCPQLTSVSIPSSLRTIGAFGFYQCLGLTNISIPGVTSIGEKAFGYCTGLTSITIPEGVISIGIRAFESCAGLTSITIPSSVSSFGNYAFTNCTNMESVTVINGVGTIGNYTFLGCTKLNHVIIEGSATTIGVYAFANCQSLTSISIPSGTTNIYTNSFSGTGLTSVIIPSGVVGIAPAVFASCSNLSLVEFAGNAPAQFDTTAFNGTSPDLIIYVPKGASGYTGSSWTAYLSKIVYSNYNISLDQSGTYAFSSQTAGYSNSALSSLTTTVSNSGNRATDALTVALSGSGAGDFTLNTTNISSIAVSGSAANFTVTPKTGLAAGTHTATVTVAGGHGITSSFMVSFTVNEVVNFSALSANGTSNTSTTTEITITFDKDVSGLTADDFTLTGATKGALTKAAGTGVYALAISNLTVANGAEVKVEVARSGFIFSPADKTVTVSVAAPAPTVDNTTGSNNVTTGSSNSSGKIITDQQKDGNAPGVTLNNKTDELKDKIFTAEELSKVTSGEDAEVILKVTDISASVSQEDKELITKEFDENTAVLYVDLSLYKKIGDGAETKITETNGKISVSIEVPESLWNTDTSNSRTYQVIRIHDGVATVIQGTYDATTHMFTFETDRFSTYALSYEDTIVSTTPRYNDFYHLQLKAKAEQTSQTLTYKGVTGADGYLIYGAKCGKDYSMTELADVAATITCYTDSNLKKATYYKYQVKAYKVVNGKKVIIATSTVIHSVTTSKTYANPTKITADVSKLVLTVGKSKTIICKLVLPKGMLMKHHTTPIRYESSNSHIAIVDSKGTIKAISKGICYIYGYTQNGVYKRIKITVE